MELVCRKLKIGRKEAHDAGDQWPHLEFKGGRGENLAQHSLYVLQGR